MTASPMPPATLDDVARMLEKLSKPDAVIFTPEEAKALQQLLTCKDELIEFAQFQRARGILWRRLRGIVIGLATFVTALIFLWDQIKEIVGGAFK